MRLVKLPEKNEALLVVAVIKDNRSAFDTSTFYKIKFSYDGHLNVPRSRNLTFRSYVLQFYAAFLYSY